MINEIRANLSYNDFAPEFIQLLKFKEITISELQEKEEEGEGEGENILLDVEEAERMLEESHRK